MCLPWRQWLLQTLIYVHHYRHTIYQHVKNQLTIMACRGLVLSISKKTNVFQYFSFLLSDFLCVCKCSKEYGIVGLWWCSAHVDIGGGSGVEVTKPPLRGEREGGRRLKGSFLLSEMELLFFGKNTRCLNFFSHPCSHSVPICQSCRTWKKSKKETIWKDCQRPLHYIVLHWLSGQLQYTRSIVFWKV